MVVARGGGCFEESIMSWTLLRPFTGGERRLGGFVKIESGIGLFGSFFCLMVFDNFRVWLPEGEISRIGTADLTRCLLAEAYLSTCFMSSFIKLATAAAFTLTAYPHEQQVTQFFIPLRTAKGTRVGLVHSIPASSFGISQRLYMAGPWRSIQAQEKPE